LVHRLDDVKFFSTSVEFTNLLRSGETHIRAFCTACQSTLDSLVSNTSLTDQSVSGQLSTHTCGEPRGGLYYTYYCEITFVRVIRVKCTSFFFLKTAKKSIQKMSVPTSFCYDAVTRASNDLIIIYTWGVWHPWTKIIGDVHSVMSKKNRYGFSDTFLLYPHTWPFESEGDVNSCWSEFW